MQALRVLHVTPYGAEAWAYGGIPRVSDALARGLAGRGHHVTVCTTDARDARRRIGRPSGTRDAVDVRVFPNVSNRLAYDWQLFMPLGLSSYLRRHRGDFDVAHLHACRNLPGVIAATHMQRAGVPYVLAPHGTAPVLERRRAAKRIFDVVAGRRVLHGASRVLAVTQAERRQLEREGVAPDRIAVVPNPMALSEFDPPPARGAFRRRAGIPGPLVAYLGKLTPRKRVDVLVRAFAGMPGNATLVVAGNDMGSDGTVRAAARAAGDRARIVFTGLLEGAARLELLADADLVVYPSEHEIFGLVPLEALLAGTPVVVANDSGCGEVVAAMGGGLVVNGDAAAVRGAMEHILAAPAHWRDAAAQAAERIRTTYAPDVVCAQLEDVYRQVACPERSRGA
ncbi:MAG: glycosyltransferase [Acidimicrobiia bacterium]|nr:glycosyltransferase [Acidimicrobiia bacterium]